MPAMFREMSPRINISISRGIIIGLETYLLSGCVMCINDKPNLWVALGRLVCNSSSAFHQIVSEQIRIDNSVDIDIYKRNKLRIV